jgi:hypothetical protein
MDFIEIFNRYKEPNLSGRYVTNIDIAPLLEPVAEFGKVKVAGKSVNGNPIYFCCAGSGKTKMLLWSQMHGNESTTTKAVFDLLKFLGSDNPSAEHLLKTFTFFIVPILNPDGAVAYTRENANNIDLNRDFCDLTQPESKLLLGLFEDIKPDYCYNLHDQRTIFGAGNTGKPATVSFLAPSYNDSRDINESRAKAIDVICAMNDTLQEFIPGQIGRFDDSFNINCVGDTLQARKVPTILFEAGHYPDDYQREETRKFIFIALLSSLMYIFDNVVVGKRINDYLNIPQNKVCFYDFVYKNVKINYDGIEKITNFAAQYREELSDGRISFNAYIADVQAAEDIFGHRVYDAGTQLFADAFENVPLADQKANFHLGTRKFVNGVEVRS